MARGRPYIQTGVANAWTALETTRHCCLAWLEGVGGDCIVRDAYPKRGDLKAGNPKLHAEINEARSAIEVKRGR